MTFGVRECDALSVSSNGSTWVKLRGRANWHSALSHCLSVSSNGSTWVKRKTSLGEAFAKALAFSILERIDVGETSKASVRTTCTKRSFSILERIDVGETFFDVL